jgi:phosphate:Na+ symporter
VGILQALSATGQMTYGTAIPIIMGQNIGTCVTALISCVGTNKNARRAAMVHLLFNIIGTTVLLTLYCTANAILDFSFAQMPVNEAGIAMVHTTFNLTCTALLLPFSAQLEKLACLLVRDSKKQDELHLLDERLMMTPAVALGRCREVACAMARISIRAFDNAMKQFHDYNPKLGEQIRADEALADQYEDQLGTYLVQLSSHELAQKDSQELSGLLRIIGDFERISDHAVNLLESAEEIRDKKLAFSGVAERELRVMFDAVSEVLTLSERAFCEADDQAAARVEPLEQVVDLLRDQLKVRHIERLRQGKCTIELGFVLSDILTNLERVSDHCSNIAACVIETAHDTMGMHGYLSGLNKEQGSSYQINYQNYLEKYTLA